MSWIDRINNIELTVTTGEGSTFTPLYKSASRSRNMNASAFNFYGVEGTLIRRSNAESMKYPFEFHFTGENSLDEAERFNQASLDIRPWTITHPEYGDILVQPININFNNSALNDSVVSGELFETITDTFPRGEVDTKTLVLSETTKAYESAGTAFATIRTPSDSLISTATTATDATAEFYLLSAVTDVDVKAVQDSYNNTLNALKNITNDPLTFMNRLTELATTPAKFSASVNDRLTILNEAYEGLKLAVGPSGTAQNKTFFSTLAGAYISAMAETAVLPFSSEDYETRNNALEVIAYMKDAHQDYIDYLGTLQSEVDATPDSFTPNAEMLSAIKTVINTTTGQLIQIAIEAKQERKYTLPSSIGIVKLVHRLLGTIEDDRIQSFAKNNNVKLNEWLQFEKGRTVIYYL